MSYTSPHGNTTSDIKMTNDDTATKIGNLSSIIIANSEAAIVVPNIHPIMAAVNNMTR